MKNLNETAETLTNRVLVYGPPKSGKTELIGRLSERFNLLWFDLENGIKTLRKLPEDWRARIFPIQLPDTRVYPIAIETCNAVIKGIRGTICEEHGKWNCLVCKKNNAPTEEVCLNDLDSTWIVVFDSLTQLGNSTMAHLTRHQDDLYKPEWDDYRSQGFLLDKFLSQVQQAPFNVCIATHETGTKMEDGKEKLVPVSGTTNFSRNTAKYFDDVVYCNVTNKKHTFASGSTWSNQILTGSRTAINLEDQANPTLLPFFDPKYIAEKKTKEGESSSIGEKEQAKSGLEALRARMKQKAAEGKS